MRRNSNSAYGASPSRAKKNARGTQESWMSQSRKQTTGCQSPLSTQDSWDTQSSSRFLPDVQNLPQDVKLRAEVAMANKDKITKLPRLTSVELKLMSVEKLLQELASTEELLELNAERQSKLVTGRLRKSKIKLQCRLETKARQAKRGLIPSPRWPELPPSSTLTRILDNSPPPIRKSMSSPMLRRASNMIPEDLFSWVSSINSPNRSLSTLNRLLSPIPQAMRKSPRSPPEQEEQLPEDDDTEPQELAWHFVAILGAAASAGTAQIEVTRLKDNFAQSRDDETYTISIGDDLVIDEEYYRVTNMLGDRSLQLNTSLAQDLAPMTQIKKLDILPRPVGNDVSSCKSRAFKQMVETVDTAELRAMTDSTCQDEASVALPQDDKERKSKLLDLYLNSSFYGKVSKAILENSVNDLKKYGSFIHELIDIFCFGQEDVVCEPFMDGTVWRDCELPVDDLRDYVDAFTKSQSFCWTSFTSTSSNEERVEAGNLTFRIDCRKQPEAEVGRYYPCVVNKDRNEVMWPPHSQFHFVNAQWHGDACTLEFETADSPSIWELLEKEDWIGFEKWARQYPDKVDTAARKFSIICAIARHMTKEPDRNVPNPFNICLLFGVNVNEVDKVTRDTPALTIAQKQADGYDLANVLSELIESGADVNTKNEFGISVVDVLPDFDYSCLKEPERPESRSSMQSRLSRKLTFSLEPTVFSEENELVRTKDRKNTYLKQKRLTRAGTLFSRSSKGTPLHKKKTTDELYVQDAAKGRGLQIDRCLILSSWNRLSSGGELATDEIVQLLAMAGHTHGEQKWIDTVMAEHYGGCSSLDSDELMDFVTYYEEKFCQYITEEFTKADKDNSGKISSVEISSLLRMMGMTPTPGVVDELMWEITGVDDGMTELSLEEFLKLHDLLSERAGFSRSEVMELQSLFERYDRSGDGRIDAKELSAALSWSGLGNDKDMVSQLLADVESSEDGINQKEFLLVMRKRREQELVMLRAAFGDSDEDVSGAMDAMELPHVFEKLGFMAATPEIVTQCANKCGIDVNHKGEYVFEDIYILLEEFRSQEGFLDSELEEIRECFERFDTECNGAIGGVSLGNAIRWLGYPQTMEQLQEHLEEFDIDESGTVDFQEFLKVMRQYREQEAVLVRRHFREKDTDGSGTLSEGELKMVLLFLGHSPSLTELKVLYKEICGDGEMDLWQLDTLVRRYRAQARERFRKNRGFTEREVAKMEAKFREYQPDKDGALQKRHLAALMADLFPDADRNEESHRQAAEILKQVDHDGDGKLEFDEYLQLMRLLQDQTDIHKIEKEKTAVQATGFLREEVAEFRKIFQMFDSDASGEMDFDEFKVLIGSIVPVQSLKASRDLQSILSDIDNDGNRSLDFPEFLRIMRRVQDDNWGDINERAAETAEVGGGTTERLHSPSRAERELELQRIEDEEEAAQDREEEDDLRVELGHFMVDRLRRYAKVYGASIAERNNAESANDPRGAYVGLILSKHHGLKKETVEQLREHAQRIGATQAELDAAADIIDEKKAYRKLVLSSIRKKLQAMEDEDDKHDDD